MCHLGDLAHAPLSVEELTQIKDSDVLLVPVGGYCTINATQAAGIVSQVEPRIIVPMHYATDETRGYVELDDIARFCRELGASEVAPRNRLNVTASAAAPRADRVCLLERGLHARSLAEARLRDSPRRSSGTSRCDRARRRPSPWRCAAAPHARTGGAAPDTVAALLERL